MLNFREIISVSLILFSVIDIVGSIPVIIDLRQKVGKVESEKATLIALVVLVSFLYLGEQILALFSLDVSSFAIAGAIVLFLLGCEMILGIHIFKADTDTGGGSIVPLAFPLIAGAGTMTTILALKSEFSHWNILVGILLNMVFVYITLKTSTWIEKKLGKGGVEVLRKVFGIILLAIAVKMFKNNIIQI